MSLGHLSLSSTHMCSYTVYSIAFTACSEDKLSNFYFTIWMKEKVELYAYKVYHHLIVNRTQKQLRAAIPCEVPGGAFFRKKSCQICDKAVDGLSIFRRDSSVRTPTSVRNTVIVLILCLWRKWRLSICFTPYWEKQHTRSPVPRAPLHDTPLTSHAYHSRVQQALYRPL